MWCNKSFKARLEVTKLSNFHHLNLYSKRQHRRVRRLAYNTLHSVAVLWRFPSQRNSVGCKCERRYRWETKSSKVYKRRLLRWFMGLDRRIKSRSWRKMMKICRSLPWIRPNSGLKTKRWTIFINCSCEFYFV